MGTYVSDTFTDTDGTDLSAHTPTVGTGWAELAGVINIESNKAACVAFSGGYYFSAPSPSGADYFVEADVVWDLSDTSAVGALLSRAVYVSSQLFGYALMWDAGAGNIRLVRVDFGVFGDIDASGFSWTSGDSHHLALAVAADSIQGFVDGSLVVSATDSTYTVIGSAGVFANTAEDGSITFDNYLVSDTGGGGGGGTPVTGTGTLSISSPSTILVDITPTPVVLGTGKGNPTRYFDLGNVSFGKDGYFSRNYYLEHEHERISAPFAADTLAYSIGTGLTATITEAA